MNYVFGHKNPDTDTIASSIFYSFMIEQLGGKFFKPIRLGEINDETNYALKYFNVQTPELIEQLPEKSTVALVDHNEFGQSINNIKDLIITEVIDHHKVSGFETKEPLKMRVEPVGSTATLLFKIASENKIEITQDMAGLLASAIISDTLLLKSPTTTEYDKYVLTELAKIANIDVNTYGLDLLKAGANILDKSISQVINSDAKSFDLPIGKGFIGQVNVVELNDVFTNAENYKTELEMIIKQNQSDFGLLIVTDILNSTSKGILVGDKSTEVAQLLDTKVDNGFVELPGVVSRKKQIVPKLS